MAAHDQSAFCGVRIWSISQMLRKDDEGVVDVWGGLPSVARKLWRLQAVQVEGVMPPLSLW